MGREIKRISELDSANVLTGVEVLPIVQDGKTVKATAQDLADRVVVRDGIDGIDGIDGAKGDKGDTGDTGLQGIQGIQGIQGEKGDAVGLVSYETLTDLPVTGVINTSYKVTNDDVLSSNNGYYHWNGSAYVKDADLANGVIESGNVDAVSGGTVFSSQKNIKGNTDTQPTVLEGYSYNSNGVLGVSATYDCIEEPIKCLTDKLYITNVSASSGLIVHCFSGNPPSSGNKLGSSTVVYSNSNAVVTLPIGTKYALILALQTENIIDSGFLVSSFDIITIDKPTLDTQIAYIPTDLLNESLSIISGVTFTQEYLYDFEIGKEYRVIIDTDSDLTSADIYVRTKLITSIKDYVINFAETQGTLIDKKVITFTASANADRIQFVVATPLTSNTVSLIVKDNLIATNNEFDELKARVNYLDSNYPTRAEGYTYNSNGDVSVSVLYDIFPVLDVSDTDVIYLGIEPIYAYGFSGFPSSGTKLTDQIITNPLELLDNGFYKITLEPNCNYLCIVVSADDSAKYSEIYTVRPPYQKYDETPNAVEKANISINDFSISNIHDYTIENTKVYSTTTDIIIPLRSGYSINRIPCITEIPSSNYIMAICNAKIGGELDTSPSDLYYFIYDKADLTTIVYEGVFVTATDVTQDSVGFACSVIFNNELYIFFTGRTGTTTVTYDTYVKKVNSAISFGAIYEVAISGSDGHLIGSNKAFQYNATTLILPMSDFTNNPTTDAGFYVVDMTTPTTPTAYAKWIGRTDIKASECNVYLADDGVNIVVNARTNFAYRAVKKVGYAELDTTLENYLGNERPANLCMEGYWQNGNSLLRSAINPTTFSTAFNRVNLTLFLSLDNGKNMTKVLEYESGDCGYGYSDIFVDEANNDIYVMHEATASTMKLKLINVILPTTLNVI